MRSPHVGAEVEPVENGRPVRGPGIVTPVQERICQCSMLNGQCSMLNAQCSMIVWLARCFYMNHKRLTASGKPFDIHDRLLDFACDVVKAVHFLISCSRPARRQAQTQKKATAHRVTTTSSPRIESP